MKAALVIALAFGCAALSAADGVWLDVPFIRQEANGCGAASLAMILDYWDAPGLPHDAADIQRQLYDAKRKGIAADRMREYLEAHGFAAYAFSGQWADLRHHVALGRPLIVALKVGADNFHYAVVAGATDTSVSLNDPADRKLRLLSRADFEKKWAAAGQWTLLAVPLRKS
jgi:ABC-type bacteriocin/lantibiotic exporter with double-glycine peptidase domain